MELYSISITLLCTHGNGREKSERGCPATSNAKFAEAVHEKGLEKWRL